MSDNFAAVVSGGNTINSETPGNITVRVPAGNVKYDGSITLAKYGVAAVIIAPGPEVDRNGTMQDRSVGNGDDPFDYTSGDDTDEDTDPGIINPVNYLDLMVGGVEDNASFTQDSSTDGFVLGSPNLQINPYVNDQIIVITAEEVTALAEKAALEAYRNAIDNYQQAIWGAAVANYRYPWVNAHADIPDLNIYHANPANPASRIGRVPFLDYYIDHDSHVVISDLQINYDITLNSLADNNESPAAYIDAFSGTFAGMFGAQTLDITDSNLSFVKRKFDGSADVDNDSIGTLVAETLAVGSVTSASVSSAPGPITRTRFFWDGCASCFEAADGWELCDAPATDQRDCAKDINFPHNFEAFAGGSQTDFSPHADIRIRSVRLQMQFDPDFEIQLDYSAAPAFGVPTAPTAVSNARITATHNPAAANTLVSIANMMQTDAKNFIDVNVLRCEQDNIVGSTYNAFFLFNDDGGTANCTLDLQASVTYNQLNIVTDYYPLLPDWVRKNDWNNSIMMAYAPDYSPALTSDIDCTSPSNTCLTINDSFNGVSTGGVSLLLGAGANPTNIAELLTIFDGQNTTPLDDIFSLHPNGGNDAVLIMNET
ncbi:MAG: hypothetical protein GY935_24420 [Gammaproteobacteria bacterium]|nr:hypothetical protein [Gammaproteobacteria bacterium]